jgi:hypothetical protein
VRALQPSQSQGRFSELGRQLGGLVLFHILAPFLRVVRFEQTHFVIRSSGAIALGHRGCSHEHSGTVQKRRAAVFL